MRTPRCAATGAQITDPPHDTGLCWLRLLCLDRSLADAEPKTLRYRLCESRAV